MEQYFFILREGKRLSAIHAEVLCLNNTLYIDGRKFHRDGNLIHWSHLTDKRNHLVGFVIDSLEQANRSFEWKTWWSSFENREIDEFHEAYIFLAHPMPDLWNTDCSLLVGGEVFSDGLGDFVIVIPDENGSALGGREPVHLWDKIGFQLGAAERVKAEFTE